MSSSSGLQGKVGPWTLKWASVPKGPSGSSYVEIGEGQQLEVRWRKDADGIWIELPEGVYGFDIRGQVNESGVQEYRVSQRGSSNCWTGLVFARPGEEHAIAAAAGQKKATRVRAQMPGKIVRVLVKPGAEVEREQPLIVMEAMKMENEIRSPQSGRVSQVKVSEGQAVESGAELILIDV